eukprot:CAMPEP_0197460728 /NCGR_PEP_ID=MMETSP1175-20131217/54761_1 /TAXON_ID=1003142 /ORGANISM="Triceratium dubium, Strain CCMP147" /LENGTH=423 /DNA_ID=CAMNT_0042995877 /DNA_START=498 /DNA_END=1769 /DNA_ORIENTATION=+
MSLLSSPLRISDSDSLATSSDSGSVSSDDSTLMSDSTSSSGSSIITSTYDTSCQGNISAVRSVSCPSSAPAVWSGRGECLQSKKEKARRPIARARKLQERDKFLKSLQRKALVSYLYPETYVSLMKKNEDRARTILSKDKVPPEGLMNNAHRRVMFELFHSVSASAMMLIFCTTHVAIYEFLQMFVQDFLELNEYENQTLVYTGVLLVALIMARTCGRLYEWTSDEGYKHIKFDMHNKLIVGDFDARVMSWFKKHPIIREIFDVVSLYLCYLAANFLITETMMKTFLDTRDNILTKLPSSQYPDISTHIKSMLCHGEKMFEDATLSNPVQVPATLSTACAVLGGDLCDQHIFESCSRLDEFRSNLTAADGEYLYDEVSFNTYYKIIGDTSAGVYYYEHGMVALLGVFFLGVWILKRSGVGFWD